MIDLDIIYIHIDNVMPIKIMAITLISSKLLAKDWDAVPRFMG